MQSPPVSAPPPACSSLIPAEWSNGVPHAPTPAREGDDLAQTKAWIGFATAEAANLEMANGRTRDALAIVSRCEARDAQAVKVVGRHRLLGLF
ncbi:MAG: hypothetical protein KGJ57_06760 [Sphingomonadales bacterium]|nr:hypothetical protein [Sphingomonadales bacterium]MDE2169116.1 hypothetical protein [Sphingomonadales bacterium]